MRSESCSFQYLEHIGEIFDQVRKTQWPFIDQAARTIAGAIAKGRTVYIFGASHAGILAQEMFYRTGGLAVINPILPAEFMLNQRPVDRTSAMEKLEGYPAVILNHTPIEKGDVLILHSVSGRNAAAVEMGLEAGKKGVYTIAVTNMAYTRRVASRHSSGKRLYEVCQMYIDNCGDFGDSSVSVPGMDQKLAPTSSVIGCGIVNMLEIRIVEYLLEMAVDPPVFCSANVDGGDTFNQMLFEKYKAQIHYMN